MNSQRILISLTLGSIVGLGAVTASAQSGNRPVVITPPAVQDGSNWSRAPFPAQRQFDDVKPADGQAIDTLGANSEATKIEPPLAAPRVAIFQPAATPANTATMIAAAPVTVSTEPVLTPTGRSTVALASTVDAATYAPTIRVASYEARGQTIADIENRLNASETALASVRSTSASMNADGRKAFASADDEVKAKAKALRKSIKAANKTSASEWDNARAQLAADYDAYALALANVDATAR
ncbi:MAG: hypothetical protein V4773_29620 [Verrucomicrobiota bacterium]